MFPNTEPNTDFILARTKFLNKKFFLFRCHHPDVTTYRKGYEGRKYVNGLLKFFKHRYNIDVSAIDCFRVAPPGRTFVQ